MPFGDLTVSEGKLVRWLKDEGDTVTAGEIVAEIETDKAVVEIEAPVAGRLVRVEQAVGFGCSDGRPHRADPAGELRQPATSCSRPSSRRRR